MVQRGDANARKTPHAAVIGSIHGTILEEEAGALAAGRYAERRGDRLRPPDQQQEQTR